MPSGPDYFDFMYTSNIAYFIVKTYYMLVSNSRECHSNTTRNDFEQSSFTLTLLKQSSLYPDERAIKISLTLISKNS